MVAWKLQYNEIPLEMIKYRKSGSFSRTFPCVKYCLVAIHNSTNEPI